MSHMETNEDVVLTKRLENYCCSQKQYYTNSKSTLVNTLQILPRVVIYKKSLKIGSCYESIITIKNEGLHNRRLLYSSDSNDITISVHPDNQMNNFLEADHSLQLSIYIKPTNKLNLNRRRHIFIESEHPNIKFEIPIIILGKNKIELSSFPEQIVFPTSTIGNCTFYEMILYNGNSEKTSFSVKGTNPNLSIIVPTLAIPKRDYCTILLKLNCKALNEICDTIKFKFGSETFEATFIHKPIQWSLFPDCANIQFDAIKFDRNTTKTFRLCNDSKSTIKFQLEFPTKHNRTCCEIDQTSNENNSSEENKTIIDQYPWRHFKIHPKCGTLSPNTSQLIDVTFHPIMHEDFSSEMEIPPFLVETKLFLKAQDELKVEQKSIRVKGFINGPDIEIIPKFIDFRNVYFGEEQCATIKAINVDGLTECHVDYYDFSVHDDGNVMITPDGGYDLKPCQSAIFNLQFFAKVIGKFMIKLQFKVRNGNFFTSIIRGISQQVRVKCFPEVLELNSIPICVPQKRLVLIINPLSVPITVQCTVPNDGIEIPLVLNVNETHDHLPITVKDPVKHMQECHKEEEISLRLKKDDAEIRSNEENAIVELENSEISLQTYRSIRIDDNSSMTSYSTEFQENALDFIPTMATSLLHHLKKIKIFDKPEMEKKVIDETISALLQTSYFHDMDKYKNYCNMDWNSLPSDPKEIYCNNEIIFLHPNTGKVLSVMIIPNVIGDHQKFLEFRVCPILPSPEADDDSDDDSKLQQIVRSSNLLSRLWIEYNCEVPEIRWGNVIDMKGPHYAGELYEFEMVFENCSKIGGFFFYDVIKDDSHITIYPEGGQLAPTGQSIFVLMEMFYTDPGLYRTTLNVIMQYETIKKIPIIIHVEGMSIFFEPNIQIENVDIGMILCTTETEFNSETPNYSKTIQVINRGQHSYRIVITKTKTSARPICHMTPIKARLLIKPSSIVMGPMTEDQFVITANACEALSVHNEFRIDIVDLAEPTIKKSSRFVIKAEFTQPQLIWNRREISIDYCRTHKYKEHPQWELLKLSNTTNNFIKLVCLKIVGPFLLKENFEYNPLKDLQFSIHPMESKEVFIVLDKNALKEFKNSSVEGRISCSANSHKQKSVSIKLNIYTPTINIKQNNVILFVKNSEGGCYIPIHNAGNVPATYKWLKIQETWRYISEEDDHEQVADIIISDIINSLQLETIIFENDSEPNMTKRYKKLRCYLPKLNDPIGIRKILDDVINELDLTHKRYKFNLREPPPPAEPKLSSSRSELLEDNKCLHELSPDVTENYIQDVNVNQEQETILENLSKRQDADIPKTLYFNKTFSKIQSTTNLPEQTSSRACVYHTLDAILNNVKLEDSYTISEPCIETCDPKGTVYFFEKCGTVQGQQMEMCALHIPPIRRGYEVSVAFQLQVVGGQSQEFHIKFVNLKRTLKLSKECVYLGVKPWYENVKTQVIAENITHYEINLNMEILPKTTTNLPSAANGNMKMLNNKELILKPLEKIKLKFEGIMGINEDGFERELCITINNGERKSLKFRGQGIIPMLIRDNRKLPYEPQTPEEIIDEYRFLQKIYYFEIFSDITKLDEENTNKLTEENDLKRSSCSLMELTSTQSESLIDESQSTTARSTTHREKEFEFFRCLFRNYVLINNNQGLPDPIQLEQLLETEKFLQQLHEHSETGELFKILYREYQNVNYDRISKNLKHFVVQPLPFNMRGLVLDLGKLVFNQYRKYSVSLDFLGPGILIAAARSAIEIPGVFVDFEAVDRTGDSQFIYDRSDKNQCQTKSPTRYRNMYERELDAEIDPKVKHAHSFDIDKQVQHQRRFRHNRCQRKWLQNYYGSLNKSIYAEHKHLYTHCKIFTKNKKYISSAKLNVVILIRPEKRYYLANQHIEDYVFIDLHMGPTLPILLRGTITEPE
ncbi:uncharacterized protein LOC133334406 [Musca vetustissima]|uniref:uncharacterized protein LOC133334406 n=1 Tax=Musca vetustissima TaxID=27455 RepID=UPI002AB653F0|nr:uncharacterized protein LOC133334406 [Musca vetustissima]